MAQLFVHSCRGIGQPKYRDRVIRVAAGRRARRPSLRCMTHPTVAVLKPCQKKPRPQERIYIFRLYRLLTLVRRKYVYTPKLESCNDDGSLSPVDEVGDGCRSLSFRSRRWRQAPCRCGLGMILFVHRRFLLVALAKIQRRATRSRGECVAYRREDSVFRLRNVSCGFLVDLSVCVPRVRGISPHCHPERSEGPMHSRGQVQRSFASLRMTSHNLCPNLRDTMLVDPSLTSLLTQNDNH